MKSKFLYFFKWLIFLSVAFLSAGLIYGLGTQQTGHQTTSTLQTIDYYDSCTTVRHNSSNSYFVPTKTLSEWTSFKNNKPSDVLIENTPGILQSGSIYNQQVVLGGGDIYPSQAYRGYSSINPPGFFGSQSGFSSGPINLEAFYASATGGYSGPIVSIVGDYSVALPPFEKITFNGIDFSVTNFSAYPTFDSGITTFYFQKSNQDFEGFDPVNTSLGLDFYEMCAAWIPQQPDHSGGGSGPASACDQCPSGTQTFATGDWTFTFCNLTGSQYAGNESRVELTQTNSIDNVVLGGYGGLASNLEGAACKGTFNDGTTVYNLAYDWKIYNSCSETYGLYCR